jgi:hypothetical protein
MPSTRKYVPNGKPILFVLTDGETNTGFELGTVRSMIDGLDVPIYTISYGQTFMAARPMTIATVAAGYADGFSRYLSNKAEVLIGGTRCRVLGRVTMDLTMVDLTPVPEAGVGDDVVLYPNVVIYDYSILGHRVAIHAGSIIGEDGLGYAPVNGKWVKIPQVGRVVIAVSEGIHGTGGTPIIDLGEREAKQ